MTVPKEQQVTNQLLCAEIILCCLGLYMNYIDSVSYSHM